MRFDPTPPGQEHDSCGWILGTSFVGLIFFGAWGLIQWRTTGKVDLCDDLWSWGFMLCVIVFVSPVLLPLLSGEE